MIMPEILRGVLTVQQREREYHLKEDDHFLYLYQGDRQVAVFSSTGATVASIDATAEDDWMRHNDA